jgi:hypothetical protein
MSGLPRYLVALTLGLNGSRSHQPRSTCDKGVAKHSLPVRYGAEDPVSARDAVLSEPSSLSEEGVGCACRGALALKPPRNQDLLAARSPSQY